VGDEGPHPKLGGEYHRLLQMSPGRLSVRGITVRLGLAGSQETLRFISVLAAAAGALKAALGDGSGVTPLAG
jgi:hypothetical protein